MNIGRIILSSVLVVGVVAVIGGVVVGLAATAAQPERQEVVPRPTAVFVTEAEPTPIQLAVRTQGEVTPLTEIDLVAQVSGRITFVNPSFVNGGFFEAGETLVQLEDADYRLAVTRASALVAQRRQQLIREQAEAELAREEWEALGDGEASALTLRQPQMAEAEAQLAAAQASLDEARLNLARTRISAPFDGRVRTKGADVGQFVGPGARLGRVFSTDRVEVRLPLTNSELATLAMPLAYQANANDRGPLVQLSASLAGETRVWEGRVVRTDSAIDPQTRTMSAIVEVADPYGAAAEAAGAPLAVGLFVNAEIEGRSIEYAYSLPRSALRGSSQMFVAELDGTLSIRNVTVADSSAERVIVTSGIEAGERVVTSPLRGAANGMLIRALGPDGEPLDPEPEAEEEADAEAEVEAVASQAGARTR